MPAPSPERTLTYRLAQAYDCWGRRRSARCGSQHGIWYLDPLGWDVPASSAPATDRDPGRLAALARMAASGQFTEIELRTLRALVVERLTIAEIAALDGCTTQAVLARLCGNSRGQGGLLKKARRFRAATTSEVAST